MLVLLHLVGPEAQQNSQICSAAMSRDQAAKLFGLAAKMVRMSTDLSAYVIVRDSLKELFCAELGTLYQALSAEADKNFGSSPVLAIHDELGQVRGPQSPLYEAIETGMGAHGSPLSIVISTQAPTDLDLLSKLIDDAKSGTDPKVKIFMFSADEALDPFSDESIRQANPAFGDFLNEVEIREQAQTAKRMPSAESGYRNLILNQRVSQSSPLIPRPVWELNAGPIDEDVFRYAKVYIGLDLSARNDLTALLCSARDEDGVLHIKAEFFAPADGIKDRAHRDRAPYDVWARQGFLTTAEGASVDYEVVAQRLAELCDEYEVAAIAFDRWRIDVLRTELKRLGREVPEKNERATGNQIPLIEFGQGFRDMSPAIDSMEAELLNGRIRHGKNPILTWCASNAMATKDPAGNRKLDKTKSTGRIDGIVALAMAIGIGEKFEGPDGPSVYEARGPLVF